MLLVFFIINQFLLSEFSFLTSLFFFLFIFSSVSLHLFLPISNLSVSESPSFSLSVSLFLQYLSSSSIFLFKNLYIKLLYLTVWIIQFSVLLILFILLKYTHFYTQRGLYVCICTSECVSVMCM